jgi:hypothetical protein
MVSRSINTTAGEEMTITLVEGILLISLLVNAYCLRKITKAEADIEMLYEGTAMCMTKLGLSEE